MAHVEQVIRTGGGARVNDQDLVKDRSLLRTAVGAPVAPPPRLLMGPGPITVDPRILRAMSAQLVGQYDPAMTAYMTETQALYREVMAVFLRRIRARRAGLPA